MTEKKKERKGKEGKKEKGREKEGKRERKEKKVSQSNNLAEGPSLLSATAGILRSSLYPGLQRTQPEWVQGRCSAAQPEARLFQEQDERTDVTCPAHS